MTELEKQTKELTCPKCKRTIKTTLYDMVSKREAKCTSCGSMYKFNSGAASNLRSSISNLENAQKKFGEALLHLMKTSDVLIKN